jgi:hypothetical protein
VPDAVLGSIASNVHASGSALEAQSVELGAGIDTMRAGDMSVVFQDATHASVLDRIRTMGQVTIRPTNIWSQGLARLQSQHNNSSPSTRNNTKRKAASASVNKASSSSHQQQLDGVASSDSLSAAASSASGPSRKRRRRDNESHAST